MNCPGGRARIARASCVCRGLSKPCATIPRLARAATMSGAKMRSLIGIEASKNMRDSTTIPMYATVNRPRTGARELWGRSGTRRSGRATFLFGSDGVDECAPMLGRSHQQYERLNLASGTLPAACSLRRTRPRSADIRIPGYGEAPAMILAFPLAQPDPRRYGRRGGGG